MSVAPQFPPFDASSATFTSASGNVWMACPECGKKTSTVYINPQWKAHCGCKPV